MSLTRQFLVIIGIPLLGMVIIFLVGIQSFSGIKTEIQSLMSLQNERTTMINADRDAYQAFLTEKESSETFDIDLLNKLDASNQENLKQTWDRIIGPGKNFTDEMQNQLSKFQTKYKTWNEHSRQIFMLSKETVTENIQILESSAKAVSAFSKMRDNIDKIGELIDTQLGQPNSPNRRRQLENALSLALNGDRDAYQAYVAQLHAIRTLSEKDMDQFDKDSTENIAQTAKRVVNAAEISGPAANSFKVEFQRHFAIWEEQSRNAIQIAKQSLDKNIAKKSESKSSSVSFNEMRDAIDKLGEMQDSRAEKDQSQMIASISNTVFVYIATVVLAFVLSIIVAFILVRSILTSLLNCINLAEKVTEGDLSVTIKTNRKDEIGKLMHVLENMAGSLKDAVSSIRSTMNRVSQGDFTENVSNAGMKGELALIKDAINNSIDMLSNTIAQVVSATDQVNSGANQISEASQSLASGTTEQAASLEEISSSMSEVDSQAKSNNVNATEASNLTTTAMEVAKRGDEQMQDMLTSMDNINKSSADISKIIKVIDEIAFQTNLLALNAAVEAARAGKYGKGFAVVAEEVRNLAARSSEAAKNTTELIENSVKEVGQGVDNAAKTAEILTVITGSVTKVNDLVNEIAASSQEQSSSTNEINKSLIQVNEVVQQNSSISEEAASASEQLSSQAVELQALMNRFNLPQIKSNMSVAKIQHELMPEKPRGEITTESRKVITLNEDEFEKF